MKCGLFSQRFYVYVCVCVRVSVSSCECMWMKYNNSSGWCVTLEQQRLQSEVIANAKWRPICAIWRQLLTCSIINRPVYVPRYTRTHIFNVAFALFFRGIAKFWESCVCGTQLWSLSVCGSFVMRLQLICGLYWLIYIRLLGVEFK